MSAGRGVKRKLENNDSEATNAERDSPVLLKKQKTPVTNGKSGHKQPLPPSTKDSLGRSAPGSKASSATEAWLKAKAQAKERKLKTSVRAGLYDDIERANNVNGRAKTAVKPLKRAEVPKSPAKTLDPLRNQKSQESFSPSRPAGYTGFFKRFTKEERAVDNMSAVSDTPPEKTKVTGSSKPKPARSPSAGRGAFDGNENEVEIPESDEGELEIETHETPTRRKEKQPSASEPKATGAWKGFVYGKPRKTFEDEIRELAETAAKKAQDDDSEDELASGSRPRKSSRKPIKTERAAEQIVQVKAASSPIVKSNKVLDRRKAKPPQTRKSAVLNRAEDVQWEVDESEDDSGPTLSVTRDEDAAVTPAKVVAPQRVVGTSSAKSKLKSSYTFEAQDLKTIQHIVLEQITGQRAVGIKNHDEEFAKVHTLINQTIASGESNSMLVVGSRGSGKTTLVNQILREQGVKHSDEFHVVRLNGFIHTDDKIALREIWRQLGKEMELDDNETASTNYADTMSKLLALLSHPAETGTEIANQVTKSVVFVLDEFDLFCGHPRQTLLYNLFDIAQSRKAPIAVLGLTTRIDAADSLEKRVKSRFSHRSVFLSLPKSYQAFHQVCQSILSVDSDALLPDRSEIPATEDHGGKAAALQWNALVEHVLSSESVNDHLRRIYFTTKSVPDALTSMMLAVATMHTNTSTASTIAEHFSNAGGSPCLQPPDCKLVILASLGTLQLAMLICAARLTNIYNTEVMSFALVYEEYKVLASKARLQASASGAIAQGAGSKIWGKDVAKDAWEELVEVGLILTDGRAGGTGRVDVGLEEIGAGGVELGAWARWCKEI